MFIAGWVCCLDGFGCSVLGYSSFRCLLFCGLWDCCFVFCVVD